jgi:hypothetical protein
MVDDFGVKYINVDKVKHLIASLKITYKLTEDWTGDLYCGIALDLDHVNCGHLHARIHKKENTIIWTSCPKPDAKMPILV